MKNPKKKRRIGSGWRFLLGLLLLVGTALSQTEKNRLAPANASEARVNSRQPPAKVMDIIGLAAGMTVAEIGAGRGRIVIHLADRVGPEGKVYAEDIDDSALQDLTERCRRGGFINVKTILGDVSDPRLPPGALDVIIVIGSYQHFADAVTLMRNARTALKKDGVVAIVDWFAEKDGQFVVSEKTMKDQMKSAGFVLDRIDKSLETTQGGIIYLFRLPSL